METERTVDAVTTPDPDGRRWLPSTTSLTPARITAVYLLLGGVALLVSDVVFPALLTDPLLRQVQAVKGAVEVLLTAGLVYVLTASREAQLRRMTARLERENRELDLLHRVLRHNLRNDLNVILAAVDRVRASVPSAEIPPECDKVEAVGRRMEKYTADARRIRKVDEGADEVREFDLAALLRDLAEDDAVVEVDIASSVPDSLPVTANYMLPEALAELVGNALEPAGTAAGRIEVACSDRDGERVTLRLACEGIAPPAGDLEAIRRGGEGDLVHANGLGLWFVVWTVERSGGSIHFDVTDDGTDIELALPPA